MDSAFGRGYFIKKKAKGRRKERHKAEGKRQKKRKA